MEPPYNAERLRTDYGYRFEQIDALTAFMAQIDPYADRVRYFMRMTEAMGLPIPALNVAGQSVFNGKMFNRDRNTDEWLDEQGNVLAVKHWGLSYNNAEEKRILHKVWFLERRHIEFSRFGSWENQTLDQHKKRYIQNPGKSTAEHELTFIENQINSFHLEYIQHLNKENRPAPEPKSPTYTVNRQQNDAPILIESELSGIPAISWELFTRYEYLQPFVFLWDMIEYKLFLLEQLQNSVSVKVKKERVNSEAQDKQERLLKRYDGYLNRGLNKKQAVDALVIDFSKEYNPNDSGLRKKSIQRVIRERNNKEQPEQ